MQEGERFVAGAVVTHTVGGVTRVGGEGGLHQEGGDTVGGQHHALAPQGVFLCAPGNISNVNIVNSKLFAGVYVNCLKS